MLKCYLLLGRLYLITWNFACFTFDFVDKCSNFEFPQNVCYIRFSHAIDSVHEFKELNAIFGTSKISYDGAENVDNDRNKYKILRWNTSAAKMWSWWKNRMFWMRTAAFDVRIWRNLITIEKRGKENAWVNKQSHNGKDKKENGHSNVTMDIITKS